MEEGDPDEREIFAYYGRAAYAASCVETGLAIALLHAELMMQVLGRARRERKSPGREAWEAVFDAFMAKQHSLTLGDLISRFKSVHKVEPELIELLEKSLLRRNYIAHHFFRDKAVDFAHRRGREAMIAELDRDCALFVSTDEAVQQSVAPLLLKLGIDPERQRAQIAEITRRDVDSAIAASRAPVSGN